MDAEALMPLSQKVLEGLISRGVKVVSYACDGTEVERAVQRLLTSRAPSRLEYTIQNPRSERDSGNYIKLTIPVIKGQPVVMIQDSKHGLKTARNNLFSGARLLVLGNFVAMYSRIRDVAFEPGSPLYIRDVEKLDRQDDNAATRLFSSATLKFIALNHPDHIGEIVFLFIFGELIDAYQNRFITHLERVKLVLRAHYFLESWTKFQQILKYPKAQYLISREALDIMRIIIEGYLSLVFIFRENTPGMWALLPWLHSSESCEHVFGEARQIVKDFTMLDFIYMVPKLRVKMRSTILHQKTSDPKAQASGYNHTYFDMTGLDELALSTFPSDPEISIAARQASDEADSLLRLVGLRPQQLHHSTANLFELPAIDSWFLEEFQNDPDVDGYSSVDTNSGSEDEGEATELQRLFDCEHNLSKSLTGKEEVELLNMSSAAFALIANEMTEM